MPMDWHTRDKVLSSETTAGKNLDPLINRSRADSFFTPTTTTNLLSDPPSQIVSHLKKITMGNHHLIRCAFLDKARKKKKEITYTGQLISPVETFGHLLYPCSVWVCECASCLCTNLNTWQL